MSLRRVVVVDYGSGNLRSVSKALEQVGALPQISGNPKDILDADALILPGVGGGDAAMSAIHSRGLVGVIRQYATSGRPFLGVCLGLQLLMESTEEGTAPCLGIVPGQVKRLPGDLKVPHMGWNKVRLRHIHPLFQGIVQDTHFYFVHSYYADPDDSSVVAGVTEYGIPFCSVLISGNLMATQFHPEKSGDLGLKVYQNFIALTADELS